MSIFDTQKTKIRFCPNCGHKMRGAVEDCTNCSKLYRSRKPSSDKDFFIHGIVVLLLSLIPLTIVGDFLLSNGFADFQKTRGYHVILFIGWMLVVKGSLWLISGNRSQMINADSAARKDFFLSVQIAAYHIPIFLYFYYSIHVKL